MMKETTLSLYPFDFSGDDLGSVADKLTQIADNVGLVPDDLVTDSGDGRPNFPELLI